MIKFSLLFFCLATICGCRSNKQNSTTSASDSTKSGNILHNNVLSVPAVAHQIVIDNITNFQQSIYLKIDQVFTGPVYTEQNDDVFYRILMVPEEENIMLIAEKISIGKESGSYKLISSWRITDDHSALPKFGLNSLDSVKFIDSVKIEGLFNGKRKMINLNESKSEN
jgi:hypothetical protein